jgi:CDP-diacylglycerol pyrophosphatase
VLHYKLWEKHGITGQGSYLYLCVLAKLRASCFFKGSFCNRARSEVKSKTVIKSHILRTIRNLWYKGSCCLDHFRINISCVRPNTVTLLRLDEKQSYVVGTARFTARQFFY